MKSVHPFVVSLTIAGAATLVYLLNSLSAQPLLLKSLKSAVIENTGKVEIRTTLTSSGRQNLLLEQIVSRWSLEPSVSAVSWVVAETE